MPECTFRRAINLPVADIARRAAEATPGSPRADRHLLRRSHLTAGGLGREPASRPRLHGRLPLSWRVDDEWFESEPRSPQGWRHIDHLSAVHWWLQGGLPVAEGSLQRDGRSLSSGAGLQPCEVRPKTQPPVLIIDGALLTVRSAALFALWLEIVVGCGVVYWLAAWMSPAFGVAVGRAVRLRLGLRGLLPALYFSAVTATSVGLVRRRWRRPALRASYGRRRDYRPDSVRLRRVEVRLATGRMKPDSPTPSHRLRGVVWAACARTCCWSAPSCRRRCAFCEGWRLPFGRGGRSGGRRRDGLRRRAPGRGRFAVPAAGIAGRSGARS